MVKTKSLEQRLQRAAELRKEGYNCAQSVVMVFDDITGIDEATAARMTSALGSGVAATGELCGVPNAMAIVAGATTGPAASDKVIATKLTAPLIAQFANENNDCLRCKDLKAPGAMRPCNELIFQGIRILHDNL